MLSVQIVDIQTHRSAINKTNAGGFGTSSNYSSSRNVFAQLLKNVKRRGVRIPLPEFGYVSRLLANRGISCSVHVGAIGGLQASDVFLIYGSLVEYSAEIAASDYIKSRFHHSRIGFFGSLPTVRPDLFEAHCDFLVVGEIESFLANTDYDLLDCRGKINVPLVTDLDSVPFPEWREIEKTFRFTHRPFFGNRRMFPVVSSRGCPLSCKYYCAYPLMAGGKVRTRSPQNIISEIEFLRSEYGMQAVMFRDPTFSIVPKRVTELCEQILNRGLSFIWSCETHPAFLTKELLELMYRAGNRAIEIGIESRTKEVIENTHRHDTQADHLKEIINTAEGLGIKVSGQYILGSLDDTRESIIDTIEYAKSLSTSFAQFSVCTPYPGTKFFDDIQDRITIEDWTKFDTFTLVFDHPHLSSSELEKLKEQAFFEYYFRMSWISKFCFRTIRDTFDRR